ncbi:MAG TPA: GNAT family N-acetyltransferase, partial [Candidatus Limnocylindria bacterium]|nr:GNAT family N-acetyltransferase [Candidatus Limnocylindria bacterium]
HGTIAGAIGLYDVDRERGRADVGYWLARKYVGRGIMTRALRALCAHAFAERGLSRIRLYSAVDNEASRALAERVGFRFVRILPRRLPSAHGAVDAALYVLRRDDAVGQS